MQRLLAFLFVLFTLSAADARAGGQDFTLVNKTGFDIHSVYISPHSTSEWQEDILGQDILASGDAVDIKFNRATKSKLWDLKVMDKNGKGYIWEGINLLEIAKVTLHYKDGQATADYQ